MPKRPDGANDVVPEAIAGNVDEIIDMSKAQPVGLGSAEKAISGRDGRWFAVRIMPYRTHDDRIDGVVITFANITVAKTLETKLRDRHAVLEKYVAARHSKVRHRRASREAVIR